MREIEKNGVVLARHIFVNDFSDSQGFFLKMMNLYKSELGNMIPERI